MVVTNQTSMVQFQVYITISYSVMENSKFGGINGHISLKQLQAH